MRKPIICLSKIADDLIPAELAQVINAEAVQILRKGFQQGITLRHLRALVALSDLKLIARVSEAIGVTQPAVSKQIAELEKIVGAPVVTRDRNRLYLTPIGARLAEHARQALGQLDRAAFDIEAMTSGVSGSVAVGVVSSVAPTLLPSTISLFKRSTPQANVSVSEGHFVELMPQLEAGALDLLIARVWQPQELAGIDQMALFSEPVVVVAGRDHQLAQEAAVKWADVANFPWILPKPNSVARQAVDALFAANGLSTPTNTVSSLSLALNTELLRAMPVLGLLPQRLAQTQAGRGELVTLPLDTHDLLSEVRCFWRTNQIAQNVALVLFLKCLEQATQDIETIPFS